MLVSFDPPAGDVDYYEIYGSDELNGTYVKYMTGHFIVPRGVLYNVPVSGEVYMRVRAVNEDGVGPFTQLYNGIISKPTTLMNVTAIYGSQIPEDSIFAVPDNAGRIIAYKASQDIEIVT